MTVSTKQQWQNDFQSQVVVFNHQELWTARLDFEWTEQKMLLLVVVHSFSISSKISFQICNFDSIIKLLTQENHPKADKWVLVCAVLCTYHYRCDYWSPGNIWQLNWHCSNDCIVNSSRRYTTMRMLIWLLWTWLWKTLHNLQGQPGSFSSNSSQHLSNQTRLFTDSFGLTWLLISWWSSWNRFSFTITDKSSNMLRVVERVKVYQLVKAVVIN